MLARVLRDRDFSGPAVIIDVGCGDGSTLAVTAGENPGHRFVGIDWSSDALRRARALGLTVLRGGVAPGLPVADGAADVVIMSELIEHLVDPDGAVAEVQAGAPAGRFAAPVHAEPGRVVQPRSARRRDPADLL